MFSRKKPKNTIATAPTALPLLFLNEKQVPYKSKVNPRAKRISLRVGEDGTVQITLPSPRQLPQGIEFASSKADWILKHHAQTREHQKLIRHRSPIKTGTIRLFGKDHFTIEVNESKSSRLRWKITESQIPLTMSRFIISLPKNTPQKNFKLFIHKAIEAYYREIAREYLSARTSYFANKIGEEFSDIRIKDTKSRWGSCSRQRNLNFNYRIMMAPKEVIDYLVVHEVCHLRHLNHSKRFWSLVSQLLPNFESPRKWLHQNGKLLVF